MKSMKFISILLFASIITGNLHAQGNSEEANLTYQLAQEEFEKANYSKAVEYLDKVDVINPEAKVKTSYLKAKCYEAQLFQPNTKDEAYMNCMKNVSYYISNGKDEEKETEIFKLKLKLESDDNYMLIKEFENYTVKDCRGVIIKIFFECNDGKNFNTIEFYNGNPSFCFISKTFDKAGLHGSIYNRAAYSIIDFSELINTYNNNNKYYQDFHPKCFSMHYNQKNSEKRKKLMDVDYEKFFSNKANPKYSCLLGGQWQADPLYNSMTLSQILNNTSAEKSYIRFLKAIKKLNELFVSGVKE